MTNIGQSSFLQALGWAVLNSLWQMAFLWILFQIITLLFKISRPSQKTSLASLFLMGGFSWFIFTFFSILLSNFSGNAIISSGFMAEYGNQKLNDWLSTTLPVASAVYLVLLILPVLQFFRNYGYVKTISKSGLSKIDVQWRMFVKKISALMGVKKPVHIWVSELVSSPVTIGFFKPIILVPLAAINHLTPQQLEAVLLHELSHIRRYDYLLNLVINLIQTILYFNPFVKAFVKIVEREREKSCDEMVMQFQYDPHGYASALLILEKANHLSGSLAVAAAGKKNDLLQRIELIVGIKKKAVISFNKLAGLFAGVLCIIALNALMIINKQGSNSSKKSFSFAPLSSPFYFFAGDNASAITAAKPSEVSPTAITQVAKQVEKNTIPRETTAGINTSVTTSVPPKYHINESVPFLVNAKYSPVLETPKLKRYQEEQIKAALEASKKVVKEGEWKAVEKRIADALTSAQKDNLKTAYLQKLNVFVDWKQLENKLRESYDKLDWDRINDQLSKAVSEIRLDSLQNVYTETADYLSSVEQKLNGAKQKGIPDSDITLNSVEHKKVQAQKVLNIIKAIRNKKIIRL
ncbi:MAG TPA: M56 family metallopeptidase [Chitinophagaceae bacterium]|nr:M56 family metallopeptidase [Chitinophagaceae bacterium]